MHTLTTHYALLSKQLQESDNEDDAYLKAQTAILKQSSRLFQQYGWCSWWGQVILSTVSGVCYIYI
jgi:hypothetical protein